MPSIYSHRLGVAVDNKYGFLVLRAFQGISAAMTIPSAYHLIVHLFPEKDKQQVSRITLYLHLILTISPFEELPRIARTHRSNRQHPRSRPVSALPFQLNIPY
jgi:hypothetical protein